MRICSYSTPWKTTWSVRADDDGGGDDDGDGGGDDDDERTTPNDLPL